MAEEKETKPKAAKKHLHRVIHEVVRDKHGKPTGESVMHHQYKTNPTDHHAEPERVAGVHSNPEDAGEATTGALQEAMGQGAGSGEAEPGEGAPAAGGAAPAPGGGEPGM
jgi:hypothetical protein